MTETFDKKEGYIVYDVSTDRFFTSGGWYSIKDIHRVGIRSIFSLGEIALLKEEKPKREWTSAPAYMRRAIWTSDDGVEIKGQLERFWNEDEQ